MKQEVIKAAIDFLLIKLSRIEGQIKSTSQKAADAPGSMQSWSDKSKDEFSQLAGALSKEVEPIKKTIKELSLGQSKPGTGEVSTGSLVTIKRGGEDEKYLLVSGYGGDEIKFNNGDKFFLLSSKTELGKLLLNRKRGETIDFRTSKITIVEVK